MFLASRFRVSVSSTFSALRTGIQASAVHQQSVMLLARNAAHPYTSREWKSDFASPGE